MAVYEKQIGSFSLSVSDPSPSWFRLKDDTGQEFSFVIEEARDIRYLLDRAIDTVERQRR